MLQSHILHIYHLGEGGTDKDPVNYSLLIITNYSILQSFNNNNNSMKANTHTAYGQALF